MRPRASSARHVAACVMLLPASFDNDYRPHPDADSVRREAERLLGKLS